MTLKKNFKMTFIEFFSSSYDIYYHPIIILYLSIFLFFTFIVLNRKRYTKYFDFLYNFKT